MRRMNLFIRNTFGFLFQDIFGFENSSKQNGSRVKVSCDEANPSDFV